MYAYLKMSYSFQGILIKHRLDNSSKQSKKVKSCGREKASINLIIKHNHIGLCADERLYFRLAKIFPYFIIYSDSMS